MSLASQFSREGFAAPLRIHDPDTAARVRARFDALEAAEGRDAAQIRLIDRHFDQRFVWELATHPAVLDAVQAVLGPNILLLATHFFCKYGDAEGSGFGVHGSGDSPHPSPLIPHPSPYVAWHQDVTYWG